MTNILFLKKDHFSNFPKFRIFSISFLISISPEKVTFINLAKLIKSRSSGFLRMEHLRYSYPLHVKMRRYSLINTESFIKLAHIFKNETLS